MWGRPAVQEMHWCNQFAIIEQVPPPPELGRCQSARNSPILADVRQEILFSHLHNVRKCYRELCLLCQRAACQVSVVGAGDSLITFAGYHRARAWGDIFEAAAPHEELRS